MFWPKSISNVLERLPKLVIATATLDIVLKFLKIHFIYIFLLQQENIFGQNNTWAACFSFAKNIVMKQGCRLVDLSILHQSSPFLPVEIAVTFPYIYNTPSAKCWFMDAVCQSCFVDSVSKMSMFVLTIILLKVCWSDKMKLLLGWVCYGLWNVW